MSTLNEGDYIQKPGLVAAAIKQMRDGGDPGTSITNDEGDILEKVLGSPRTPKTKLPSPKASREFTPKGESTSGQPKAPDIPVQTQSIYDGDEAGDDDGAVSQPDAAETDHEEFTAVSLPAETPVHQEPSEAKLATTDDLDDVVTAIDTLINERLGELEGKFRGELLDLTTQLRSTNRQNQVLSTRLNDLSLRMDALPRTKTLDASTVPSDSKDKGVTKGSAVGPSGVTKRDSVAGPGGAIQQREIIGKFLQGNQDYPAIQAVRKVKLARLAKDLHFNPLKTEITPQQWNVDGVLLAFTS